MPKRLERHFLGPSLALACVVLTGCVGKLSGGPVVGMDGGPEVDMVIVLPDGNVILPDLGPTPDLGPPPVIDGGECTESTDCPSPPTCMEPATCSANRCVYAPSTAGTACGASTGCAVFACNGVGTCDMAPAVCNDPPIVEVPGSCSPGATFMAPLGGSCGGMCNATTGMCEYEMVAIACPDSGANRLPTTYAWQAKLREFMASLTAADFTTAPGTQFSYNASGPEGSAAARDQLGWWLAARALGGNYSFPYTGLPDTLQIMPSEFTLAQIEQSPAHAKVGWKGGVPTDYAAWLTQWTMPGNGYRNSRSEFLKGFVFSSADLMLSAENYIADNNRNVWFWPALPYYGYVGKVAHEGSMLDGSELERCALAAFDVGSRAMLRRAAEFAPTWSHDPNGDMVAMGIRGLGYMAEQLGDPEAIELAHTASADLIANNANPAGGYWDHFSCDGCYDAQYEGVTLVAIREPAVSTGWAEVRQNVENLLRTISLLSLPEPGGQLYGPSHFSPATADPPPYALAAPTQQIQNLDFSENSLYSLFTDYGGNAMSWPDVSQMQSDMHSWIDGLAGTASQNFDDADNAWNVTHHYSYGLPNFVHYRPEWYDRLAPLVADTANPLRRAPWARDGAFIQQISDDFLVAKLGNSGVVIHTGNVSTDADPHGFGGGALSAFWTSGTGSAILGWSRGGQNPKPNTWSGANAWDGWRNHITHAVVGIKGGQPFSSARLTTVTHTTTVGTSSAMVDVTADLNTNQSDPGNVLSSALSYSRSFEVGMAGANDGVRITTSLGALPSGVTELYEQLPIFDHAYTELLGEPGAHCNESSPSSSMTRLGVVFMQGSTMVTPSANTPVNDVTSIVITRYGHTAVVALDMARTVTLGPTSCTTYQQFQPIGRNVFISMSTTAGATSSISYTIRPGT